MSKLISRISRIEHALDAEHLTACPVCIDGEYPLLVRVALRRGQRDELPVESNVYDGNRRCRRCGVEARDVVVAVRSG
jgi:C4-type Zn-finger protein